MVRTGLPLMFWYYGFQIACYLINSLPSYVRNNSTLYELLFKSKTNYEHFRVFGCLCYLYTRPYSSFMLDLRSILCIFLGYPSHQKWYLCIDLTTKKLYIFSHVILHKDHFPFLNMAQSLTVSTVQNPKQTPP